MLKSLCLRGDGVSCEQATLGDHPGNRRTNGGEALARTKLVELRARGLEVRTIPFVLRHGHDLRLTQRLGALHRGLRQSQLCLGGTDLGADLAVVYPGEHLTLRHPVSFLRQHFCEDAGQLGVHSHPAQRLHRARNRCRAAHGAANDSCNLYGRRGSAGPSSCRSRLALAAAGRENY